MALADSDPPRKHPLTDALGPHLRARSGANIFRSNMHRNASKRIINASWRKARRLALTVDDPELTHRFLFVTGRVTPR